MADWPDIDFDTDPRMILGTRASGRRLDGRRIDVHVDAFADLRAVCEPIWLELARSTARPFEPFAAVERGEEYLRIDVDEVPVRSHVSDDETDGTADLLRLVAEVDYLDDVQTLDDVRTYLFYAICWRSDSGFVGFVKKTDPRRALRLGKRWLQFDDVLRRAEAPDLVLEPDIDVVVTEGFVAARRTSALTNLLTDVEMAVAGVPDDVALVRKQLKRSIPLSKDASEVLTKAASSRVSLARRVNLLPTRLAAISLDAASLRRELRRVGVQPKALLNARGEFAFDADAVEVFLDVLESRYFDDALGGERRRADRFSTRR